VTIGFSGGTLLHGELQKVGKIALNRIDVEAMNFA
jgi:hypothetical protein